MDPRDDIAYFEAEFPVPAGAPAPTLYTASRQSYFALGLTLEEFARETEDIYVSAFVFETAACPVVVFALQPADGS